MSAMASQINSLTIVYLTVYSGTDQRKHRSSASLAFVRGTHRSPVNSTHKGPVTRKMFPFDDVIMVVRSWGCCNIKYLFETDLKPKSREILFPYNSFSSYPIRSFRRTQQYPCRALCRTWKSNGSDVIDKRYNVGFKFNSLWPSDTIWRQRSGSILDKVMACCLTAPSHYLNQCWLIISEVQWHSDKGNFTRCLNH